MHRSALVVGGSGFLGSHLADVLDDGGTKVTILDRTESAYLRPTQRFVECDIASSEDVQRHVAHYDIVYHLAAIGDIADADASPLETVRVNILGTVNLLEAARRAEIPHFVLASSVYVAGTSGGMYRVTKSAAEDLVQEYTRRSGMGHTILRYGSLYGPRSPATNGLRRIVERALTVGRVEYEGDPEARREYVHVIDAARATLNLVSDHQQNRTYLVSGDQVFPVMDVLRMVQHILGLDEAPTIITSPLPGHFSVTPYAYAPDRIFRYRLPTWIDFGQGLIELARDIEDSRESSV